MSESKEVTVTTATTKLNDGNKIPTIGLGVFQAKAGGETYGAVLAALKAGYRHIDSAALYANEADVGKAVKDSGIPRDEVFITTKLWPLAFKGTAKGEGYQFAMAQAEESLAKLGTHIDLYLIHSPHHPQFRMEFWSALEELKKTGKVRSIGVSNYGVHHLEELLKQGTVPPAVNQVEIHPFLLRDDIDKFCRQHGIVVEAYSPLAKAHGFGNPVLAKLAAKHKRSEAQVMVRWSLQRGYVALPKSTNPDRIAQNAAVFGFALSEEEMLDINSLDRQMTTGWDPTTAE